MSEPSDPSLLVTQLPVVVYSRIAHVADHLGLDSLGALALLVAAGERHLQSQALLPSPPDPNLARTESMARMLIQLFQQTMTGRPSLNVVEGEEPAPPVDFTKRSEGSQQARVLRQACSEMEKRLGWEVVKDLRQAFIDRGEHILRDDKRNLPCERWILNWSGWEAYTRTLVDYAGMSVPSHVEAMLAGLGWGARPGAPSPP